MTAERWKQIGEIYHAALEKRPDQRAAFLDQACAGDQDLRREIETLISAQENARGFIETPALKDAAILMAEDQNSSASQNFEGRSFGHYQIISLLGAGGMGEVYLARDPRLERKVALKLLPADFTSDEARVRRFIQEARAASTLNHPNIITIHEIGEIDGRRYIATEYIEGQTLRRKLASGRINAKAVLNVAIQVASALGAAHSAGIVHRDVKPENVMVRPDGLVKVLDFGLAKLTERTASISATTIETRAPTESVFKTAPGTIMGTVAYMSPEQARGWDVDARSDIFSLGVVIYEMLAGRTPFAGETINHVIVAILDHDPAELLLHAPDAPPEFQSIVDKALQKDPEDRYQSAVEILADLNALKQKPEMQAYSDAPENYGQTGKEIIGRLQQGLRDTATDREDRTGAAIPALTRGGVERLIRQARFYRRGAMAIFAVVALAVVALILYFNRAPRLTEKDDILVADFVNHTGEEVFDSTLKQALALQLEQTPFLNFFPEERVRETLRYMGRPPDERVTKDLGREICQRQGVKALLVGSIARFDRRYSITLEAINSLTGETIAGALAEADGKDQVLQSLGKATTQLRERLGESLASIQKFDAPIEQATTSSLEAFKAWSRGVELTRSGKSAEALPYYKRARDLDQNFAKVYVSFSMYYINQGQLDLAAEYAARAFELKERVSEREKFDIISNYHSLYTGDLAQAIETVEMWRQTYPRDFGPNSRLASLYRLVGQPEKALAAAREANRLNPRAYVPYVNHGTALVQLNRFDEARGVIDDAIKQQLATTTSRRDLFQIGYLKGDAQLMKQQIEWMAGRSDEYWAFYWQANAASYAGQFRQADALYRRAASLVESRNPDRAARFISGAALRNAVCGQCLQSKTADRGPKASSRINLQAYVPANINKSLALAMCGDVGQAQSLIEEVAANNPHSTLANFIWLPTVRAAIEIRRGNYEPAIQLLQATISYESASDFWPLYLRGQAYLRLNKAGEAAEQFKRILDHRGWDVLSPLYPLAHLGLARASALAGDPGASRKSYQDFLAIWKDADPDIPILQAAKKEYEKLK